MITEDIIIGLVVEDVPLEGPWAGVAGPTPWQPVAVLAAAPEVEPWTALGQIGGRRRLYAGPMAIHLYSTDTANYIQNLETGAPMLWVVLRASGDERPVEVMTVTADPAEGEAHTEAGADMVGTIAMPPEVAAEVAAFCAAHHVERPFVKRQRDKAKPGERRGPSGTRG